MNTTIEAIPCAACRHANPLATTTLYRTHWYVRPHGCTGGDYWLPGEWQFVCASCGTANRLLYNRGQYQPPERRTVYPAEEAFRGCAKSFASVVDTHGTDDPAKIGPWVNNYEVEGMLS